MGPLAVDFEESEVWTPVVEVGYRSSTMRLEGVPASGPN